jgi:hypothetical protein
LNPHTESGPVTERLFNALSEPRMVDDDFGDAGCGELFEMPNDERLAGNRQQWFRKMIGEWAHALSSTCS